MYAYMHFLPHVGIVLALIPGSLLFAAVALWRILRAVVGFRKPSLPLRTTYGDVIYTEDDWHRDKRSEFPIRYALLERLPRWIKRLGRDIARPFRRKTSREVILHNAFGVFGKWVSAHDDFVYGSVYDLDDDGPSQRQLARKWEMQSLYHWWKDHRPSAVRRVEESSLDSREFFLVELEQDDEIHLARLVNIWRDLA